jgi:hypothetical protein
MNHAARIVVHQGGARSSPQNARQVPDITSLSRAARIGVHTDRTSRHTRSVANADDVRAFLARDEDATVAFGAHPNVITERDGEWVRMTVRP